VSNDKKWRPVFERQDAAGEALRQIFNGEVEICLSRSDLRRMAINDTLERFVMATLICGYPNGMQGNNAANICDNLSPLVTLLDEARSQPIKDWNKHYRRVEDDLRGVGLSTYTKFLTFLPANISGHTALILDSRIRKVGNLGVFNDFAGNFSERTYPAYLKRMHEIAMELGVPPENLELFLFEFGLSLKPPANKKMAAAQQKRWAKTKRAVKAAAKKAAAPVAAKPAKKVPVASPAVNGARKPMTAATKKKLAAAANARWAAKKAPAKTA
jgi:hypothetical protein